MIVISVAKFQSAEESAVSHEIIEMMDVPIIAMHLRCGRALER